MGLGTNGVGTYGMGTNGVGHKWGWAHMGYGRKWGWAHMELGTNGVRHKCRTTGFLVQSLCSVRNSLFVVCLGIRSFMNMSLSDSCDTLKSVLVMGCSCVLVLMMCVSSAFIFSLDRVGCV